MASTRQNRIWTFRLSLPKATALAVVFALMVVATPAAQAQTYKPIYSFAGGVGGTGPQSGVTMDARGNLYGTTFEGGNANKGIVYKLTNKNSHWIFTLLYSFAGGNDGAIPQSGVVFGPNGTLYGTTTYGGAGCGSQGCGIVFNLRPPATACKAALCPWAETVIHRFTDDPDGATPASGNVVFDAAGSLYGATTFGGTGNNCTDNSCGTVYKLTPSGGGWTECVIYSFQDGDGAYPNGVIFDNTGKLLFGTTLGAKMYDGTVFQLTPSGCHATWNGLYGFSGCSDGGFPEGGVTFDATGNLYGTTSSDGESCLRGGGTVFELKLPHYSFNPLYTFAYDGSEQFQGPTGRMVMDPVGNLYGTTLGEGSKNLGSVFKLHPNGDGTWTYTDLHDFCAGGGSCSDGAYPYGDVILDTNGNLYGTASEGGANGHGVVWEVESAEASVAP